MKISPTFQSILFKILFLTINLVTGISLARSLSLSERGIGGLIFSLVTFVSVWQSLKINEEIFRKKNNPLIIRINIYEQMLYLILLLLVGYSINIENHILKIFILIFFSTITSRLMAMTFLKYGLFFDRILQTLHLCILLIGILMLQKIGILNLNNWINLTLILEISFSILIYCVNGTRNAKIEINHNNKNIFELFTINNLFLVSEGLADRIAIFVISTMCSHDELGIFVVAISIMLVVGSPITASYPYPVVNAMRIQSLIRNAELKEVVLAIVSALTYLITCSLLVQKLVPIFYGKHYSKISEFAPVLVLSGLTLGILRYLSSVWRGLGFGLLGNNVQNLSIVFTFTFTFLLKIISSDSLNFYILFSIWGFTNLILTFYLFRKISLQN